MFLEIRLQLLLGLHRIHEKFLPGPERQPAHIAIRQARRRPHEPRNLQIPFRHRNIIAARRHAVNAP